MCTRVVRKIMRQWDFKHNGDDNKIDFNTQYNLNIYQFLIKLSGVSALSCSNMVPGHSRSSFP